MAGDSIPRVIAERCPQCGGDLPPDGGEQIICRYCGSHLMRYRPAAPGKAAKETGPGAQEMRLKIFSCVDTQGIGCEAFRLLIPAGWEFSGGVHWLLNNPGMPAVIAFQVRNPNGEEAFEVFPNISFYWTNNPMVLMNFPVGSLYFGNEVRPPAGAQQVLREIVVPRYRGRVQGLRIIHEESLPDLPNQVRANSPAAPDGVTSADGAKIRVQYRSSGKAIEEEIFGVIEVSRIVVPVFMGMMENIFWVADYLFSFRAETGQLDGSSNLFQAIVQSFRLNPQWYSRYVQVSQYLIQNQIQQIQHVGQISRIISQTSDQISDMIMDSYYQRQQTMDRLSTSFSQAIRGVDGYYDPVEQREIELPGGYEHAWANSLGEYVLSNDPNFDPNVGSNLNWQPMQRR